MATEKSFKRIDPVVGKNFSKVIVTDTQTGRVVAKAYGRTNGEADRNLNKQTKK